MNNLEALLSYFYRNYPEKAYSVAMLFDLINGIEIQTVSFPAEFYPEAQAFLAAWDEAYKQGYSDATKRAAEEYIRNIHEIVTQVHAAGYNQGFADGNEQGFEEGVSAELQESIIPSDAFAIEVFAVQPSNDFESGKQAFVGYKWIDDDANEKWSFRQVEFNVPNLTLKPRIDANWKENRKVGN